MKRKRVPAKNGLELYEYNLKNALTENGDEFESDRRGTGAENIVALTMNL